jgi:lipopolysaccharide transport system permease protein
VGVLTQVIFFVTPVFYPITMIPERYRPIILLNPLSHLVEAARRTLLWGQWPDWLPLAAVTVVSALVAQFGYAWFMRSRRGFADVI